jgi:hypothetical protein
METRESAKRRGRNVRMSRGGCERGYVMERMSKAKYA